jgi:glutathione S-transferase
LELYHSDMSTCSQKVRLVLYEKELTPVEHRLNLYAGDATRADYLKLNPNGVVPTLVDRGQAIIESSAICEYLDDAYPQPSLRPADALPRARMRAWTLRGDQGLHRACGVLSFAIALRDRMLALAHEEMERRIARKPDPAVREYQRQVIERGVEATQVPAALRVCDRVLADASRQLDDTPWLVGEEISLADTALLPYVCRLEDLSMAWMWRDRYPSIAGWLARCKARSNYRAITNYLDESSLTVMRERGSQLRAKLESLVRP